MANNQEWQHHSDEWVKMLDQSRLRKEKRLIDRKRMFGDQSKSKAVTGLNERTVNK